MLGAIAGDVIGSVHERSTHKSRVFALFTPFSRPTDDSVLTVAVADVLLTGSDYAATLRTWGRRYPCAGWGGAFNKWIGNEGMGPYHSLGNGSAMRVSPVAWAFDDLEAVIAEARRSAEISHNHPEGIRGAEATAAAIFVARIERNRTAVKDVLEKRFGYDCSVPLDVLRPAMRFDATCPGTVPPAATAFLESLDFEDAIRNAVSLGGDADTLACIAGSIAEAYYGGVPEAIARETMARLDADLSRVVEAFAARHGVPLPVGRR